MNIYFTGIISVFMAFFGCQKSKSSDDGVKNAPIVTKATVKAAPLIPLHENTENLQAVPANPEIAEPQASNDVEPADPTLAEAKANQALADPAPAAAQAANDPTVFSDSITSTDVTTTESITSTDTNTCKTKETSILAIGDYATNGFTVSCGETVTWDFDGSKNSVSGNITVEKGGTLNITGNMMLGEKGIINNAGTITISNKIGIGLYIEYGIINNAGTITISNTVVTWGISSFNGSINNNNTGAIAIRNTAGTGLYSSQGSIKNAGTITISNTTGRGLYIISGSIIDNGGKITKIGSGSCEADGCPPGKIEP